MKQLNDAYILSNGAKIPCIGFGTWLTPDGDVAVESVLEALKVGYRHIDTAFFYGNEASIGKAIRESGIPREEIFVTSKLWNTERGYEKAMAAFELTLQNLGLDYLDLYLIHWPAAANQYENWDEVNLSTWKAMTELYKAGKIKTIGVSNFKPHHLASLMETEVPPMVNQIEYQPGFMQQETVEYCKKNNILVEAWSPLGRGTVLEHETLVSIASKYQKTVAQLCIRWCLQNGTLPLPKSVTPSRIAENANVFDFVIEQADMDVINALIIEGKHHDSDNIDF